MTTIYEPILIVGAGGVGSKLAPEAAARLGASYVTISNADTDLGGNNAIPVSTGAILNPTAHVIRAAVRAESERVLEAVGRAKTVVILANLAGRSGAGIAPMVADICSRAGKKVVSFAIMPFKYEKERIFGAGIALKRLREASNCSVVVDNDAILDGNPNLSAKSCYDMANAAIMHVAGSIISADIPDGNSVVSMSNTGSNLEQSLVDSVKMLYENATPGSVSRSLLYIMGNNVPVGAIRDTSDSVYELTGSSTSVVATGEGDDGLVMLSELSGATKFDAYDPLGIIPAKKTIDWEEMESSVAAGLDLEQLEK